MRVGSSVLILSGTGIAAGTTITDIDPSGTQVTLSAVTTAAVNGTVTATYNNGTIFYNVAHINNPIAQGAIT
jgi:glycerol uptake facilitator-like aquaporin